MVCKAWALIKPPSRFLPPTNPFKLRWNLDLSPSSMFLKKWNGGSKPSKTYLFFLVGGLNTFPKYSSNWDHSPEFLGEHSKNLWNHYHFWMSFVGGGGDFQLVRHHGGSTDMAAPLRFPTLRRRGCHRSCYPIASIRSFYTPSNRWFRNPKAKSHQPKNGLGIPIVCYSYSWLEQFLFKEYVTRTNVK